jgi:hypothetical protein
MRKGENNSRFSQTAVINKFLVAVTKKYTPHGM